MHKFAIGRRSLQKLGNMVPCKLFDHRRQIGVLKQTSVVDNGVPDTVVNGLQHSLQLMGRSFGNASGFVQFAHVMQRDQPQRRGVREVQSGDCDAYRNSEIRPLCSQPISVATVKCLRLPKRLEAITVLVFGLNKLR